MKKREKLIDAMAEIDEDLLVAHAQIKKPTRMQRFRKYAGAAMIYVAACLVVALLLPFIIGKGEDPKPNPGVDPIVTETHSPVTDDPEAKKISAADIYETYFDVDPEKLSEPVILDEVKNIITAAEQAYAEYDLIILQDETVVETTPKKPDVKFSDLKDSGEENSRVAQLAEYNYQVHSVICDMLDARAPETSRVTYNDYGGLITGIPEYDNEYIDGVYSVDGEEGDIIDAQGAFSVYTVVHRTKEYSNDYSDYDFGEGYTILFPSEKEYDIIRRYHDSRRCVSVETSKFDGLELSIVLEKSGLSDGNMQYSEGDAITATVILENTGDSTMLLYQDHGGDFLDDVIFLENGEERPQYSEEAVVLNGWHAVRFDPDDYIMHSETFKPFSPYDSSAEPASMDSLWEIEAEVEYVPHFINESDYNTEKSILEERKTGTVRINVPHDREDEVVSETEIVTEATTTAPPPETTTAPPETEPPIVIPELEEGQSINGDFVVCVPNWTVEYFGNGGEVYVPDGVTLIESGTFMNNGHKITSLRIPASFNSAIVGNVFGGLTSLQYYSVDENCDLLETVNGVLYNKRVGINANVKRSLISVPGSYSEFTVPADVEIINGLAVYNCLNMKYINVDSGNNSFMSLNGVVVTKDKKSIALVPPGIEELYVPFETDESFLGFVRGESLGGCTMLKMYNVDSANSLFSSPGGLLCSKDGSVLYSVPGGVVDCVIPDGVTKIDWGSFRHTSNIANVIIPDSVTEISSEAFWYKSNLTIHCSAGSYAAQYAAENGIAWTAN